MSRWSSKPLIGILGCAAGLALGSAGAATNQVADLTLRAARDLALQNHPLIKVADLKALAARQVTRQAQSTYFPNVYADSVSVGTGYPNTRLAAMNNINNSSIFERNAEGITVSQLITDFGRTANLSGSAKLRAEAEANNAQATRDQILLAVDSAFYGSLRAQSVEAVARQTVTARDTFLRQVTALATNQLRSELDVSFARVNLADAQLLESRAQNDLEASFAQLSALLGSREPTRYHLVEQGMPSEISTNEPDYLQSALRSRPDLMSAREQQEGAMRSAKAERSARLPTLSAFGTAGVIPIGEKQLPEHYAAAGLILNVPLFAGGLYVARQKEAELRADAAAAAVRDLENNVIRDVHVAWLNAQNAFERYRITDQLLDNARQSYNLAQARYKNGISSIVELNQAELSLVSAEISRATTQYEYLTQRSALDFQAGTLR